MNAKLLSVKDVSDFLNISKSSIYTYAQKQAIPCIRLKGRLLFSQNALDTWLQTKTHEAKEETGNETE